MESNNSQPPVLSPAVAPQSSPAASMSPLTTRHGAPPRLELVTPHPQGSSRAGPVPKTPTPSKRSKRGSSRKSPYVFNFSEEDEELEVLSERKSRSYRKSDTTTPDPDKVARSRDGGRRRRQMQKDSAERLRDLVPALKTPGPDGKLKKVGEGVVMLQAADYIESLHNEVARKNNEMGRQQEIFAKEYTLLFNKAVLSYNYANDLSRVMEHIKNGKSSPADWCLPEWESVKKLTQPKGLGGIIKEEYIPGLIQSYRVEYDKNLKPKLASSARQAAHIPLIPQQLRTTVASQGVHESPSIDNPNQLPVQGALLANPSTMGQFNVGQQIQIGGPQQQQFFLSPRGQDPPASLVRPANPRMVQMIYNQVSMSSQHAAPFRPVYGKGPVYRMNTLTMPLVAAPPSVGSVSNQLKMATIEPSSFSATGNPGTGAPAVPWPSSTIEDSMEKETNPANDYQQTLNPSDDISQIMEESVSLEHVKEEAMDSDDEDNYSMLSNLEEAGGGMSLGVAKEETKENNDIGRERQPPNFHSPASQMELGEGLAINSGVNITTFGDRMSSSPGCPRGFSRQKGLRYTWDLDVNDLGPKLWSDADSDDDLIPPSNPMGSGSSAKGDEPQPSTSRGHRGKNPPSVVWNVEKDNEAFKDHPLFKYNWMFSGIGTTQEDFEKANNEIRDIATACWGEVQEESKQKEAEEQRRMEKKRKSPKKRKSDHGQKSTLDDAEESSSDDE